MRKQGASRLGRAWRLALVGTALAAPAGAGTLSVLTYNVAGLPEGISGSTPSVNTPLISPLLNAYDLVVVQEDFNYHEPLVASLTHPYQSVKDTNPGPYGEQLGFAFGDGLNTFSRSPFADFQRVTWSQCFGVFSNSSDCLTPKGFSVATHELEPGVVVDVYNLHSDAGSAEPDLAARRANIRQFYAFISEYSADRAVIVLGDTNSRYTRGGDVLPEMLAAVGLTDVWALLQRAGALPAVGDALTAACASDPSGGECERVDKIFFRSGGGVLLEALDYDVPGNFVDAAGERLSDHDPVSALFAYRVVPEPATALLVAAGLVAVAIRPPGRARACPTRRTRS
jgi:hypothetical protein